MNRAATLTLCMVFLFIAACASTANSTRITTPDGVRVEHKGEVSKPVRVEHVAKDGTKTVVEGATSPMPPTPSEHAAAKILQWYNLAAIALLIAAAVAAWRGYTRAAICFGAATLAAPLLGNFGLSTAALVITAVFVAAALAYISAWFALRRKLSPDTPAAAQ